MTIPRIVPDWPAPASVLALCTTRRGGCSGGPYESFNIADHVGDDPADVRGNRERLATLLPEGSAIQWLSQVHGTAVVEAPRAGDGAPEADAVFSRQPGQACAVMTADCLPVLYCSERGDEVAAAHAGWRGLCGGVLEATVGSLKTDPGQLLAWLGPAIGPAAFEVGPEVRAQFLDAAVSDDVDHCFSPSQMNPGHYMADLYGLARQRLAGMGVNKIYGGGYCTYTDAQRFYSYRRDGRTGRMASLILLKPA
jgi:YfiH family protein